MLIRVALAAVGILLLAGTGCYAAFAIFQAGATIKQASGQAWVTSTQSGQASGQNWITSTQSGQASGQHWVTSQQ
jgi:hypothetical protein